MHKTITLSFRAWIVRAWLLAMLLSISLLSIAQTPQYTVGGTTGSANSWPFNATSTSSSNQVELLYFPTHTNSTNAFNAPPPAGFITAVYFVPRSNTSPTHPDVFIKMGNTSLTTLPSGSWTSTAVTQVYYRSSVTLTPTSGQWMKFDLDVPFYYDGTSNIIVQMGHTGSNSGFTLTFNNGSPLTRTYGRSINSNVVGTDQEVYSFGIDIFAGFPCTDTPKTSIAGPHIVCPNKQFNLRPDSFYADATYQWQYSNNGQTWSNVTQVPGLYGDINDAITTAKWYRVKVTCD
ncbi:MAG: hypothetical protein KDC11_14355, partial [Chitinophagaceae bacterium]|nr:hypothetical protein [Chitinophagaceae bacterium]